MQVSAEREEYPSHDAEDPCPLEAQVLPLPDTNTCLAQKQPELQSGQRVGGELFHQSSLGNGSGIGKIGDGPLGGIDIGAELPQDQLGALARGDRFQLQLTGGPVAKACDILTGRSARDRMRLE